MVLIKTKNECFGYNYITLAVPLKAVSTLRHGMLSNFTQASELNVPIPANTRGSVVLDVRTDHSPLLL